MTSNHLPNATAKNVAQNIQLLKSELRFLSFDTFTVFSYSDSDANQAHIPFFIDTRINEQLSNYRQDSQFITHNHQKIAEFFGFIPIISRWRLCNSSNLRIKFMESVYYYPHTCADYRAEI